MMKQIRVWPLAILLLVTLMGAGCSVPKPVTNNNASITSPSSFSNEKIVSLAKALTLAGAREYGSQFCSACKYQKEMFGEAWKFITYVECATSNTNPAQNSACLAANIKLYPTWEFKDGSRLEGVQQFEVLAQKIGFEL